MSRQVECQLRGHGMQSLTIPTIIIPRLAREEAAAEEGGTTAIGVEDNNYFPYLPQQPSKEDQYIPHKIHGTYFHYSYSRSCGQFFDD